MGAGTLIAATLLLLLAFSWAGLRYAWTSPTILGLLGAALGTVLLLLFVERRVAEPILDLRLFTNSIFAVSLLATFLVSADRDTKGIANLYPEVSIETGETMDPVKLETQ